MAAAPVESVSSFVLINDMNQWNQGFSSGSTIGSFTLTLSNPGISTDSTQNKGSLNVSFNSLGTPDTSNGGGVISYPKPQGSYTLVLKSAAGDPDVTVTGTFGNEWPRGRPSVNSRALVRAVLVERSARPSLRSTAPRVPRRAASAASHRGP